MRVLLAVSLCSLLATATALGQVSASLTDHQVSRWTTEAGLPQNTINDVLSLQAGEVWLATFGGLVRFDGARFEVIDIASDEGLPSNRITGLAPAGRHALWFVTQEGYLGRYGQGRAETVLRPADGMPDVVSLVVDGRTFYCQTEGGAVWASDGARPWQRLPGLPERTGAAFNALAPRRNGGAWVGLEWSVAPVHDGRVRTAHPVPRSHAIAEGSEDTVWVGLEGGLARLRQGRLETLVVRPALIGRATAMLAVGPDTLWMASGGEVSLLRRSVDDSWSREVLPLGLPADNFIRALHVDQEGSLWIGTTGRDLVRAHLPPTQRFGTLAGIAVVDAVASDGRGGAWVAGSCVGVSHIDAGGRVTTVHAAGSEGDVEPGGCGLSLAAGSADGVWARWGRGLYRIQRHAPRVRRASVRLPNELGPIVDDGRGGLWVVSRGGRLQHVVDERIVAEHRLPGPLFSATRGPDGGIWLGGNSRIHRVAGDQVRMFGETEGVPRGAVRDLLIDRDGTVWIGTYGGGLGRLVGTRVSRLTSRQGLPDNAISRILDDGRGRLWLSTNRGVAVLDRRELAAVFSGEVSAVAPVVLGSDRGVPEANFGQPAGFVDAQQQVWFGTLDGVVRIDAARFPFNTRRPAVRVEQILADERPLAIGPEVAIPAGTSRVRVTFGANSFLYPRRVRYRFRIEGIDRQWVDVGPQRFATWTPSGPGRHRFLLEARNEDGLWTDTPVVVELVVQPAWWQTTLARSLGASALLLLGLVLYRWRVGRLERRHADRVHALEERRRTEEQALALRTQLEHVSRVAIAGELAASLAHEVNQPLTAIVTNAEAAQHVLATSAPDRDAAQEMLGDIVTQGLRASEVVRGLREFLRTGHPTPAPLDLSVLVREVLPLVRREIEQHRIALELALADDLPTIEGRRVQLGQVVVNLVMNACEAMDGSEAPRRLRVETHAADDRVELVVQDNGPGVPADILEKVFEPFVSTKPQGMGMGLAICRSIADAHRGRLTIEPAPGRGLRCVLSLPVPS